MFWGIQDIAAESRHIPINDHLTHTLADIPRRLDIPHVFFNPATGKPYTEIKRSFARACKQAGIVDCTFHTLRHTFASLLVMAGVDLTTVKELMGHSNISTTAEFYNTVDRDHEKKAAKVVQQLLDKNKNDVSVTYEGEISQIGGNK